MKRLFSLLSLALVGLMLFGCGSPPAQIAATTLPVYEFTSILCQGTPLTVTRLVTESVSCLHDYTLTVSQMRAIEGAETVVLSGAGLEDFMEDALTGVADPIDASLGIELLEGECHHHHEQEDPHHHDHDDEVDAHIWLSADNALTMAQNICQGLCLRYPAYEDTFRENLLNLTQQIQALQDYAKQELSHLSSREIITFHDGFSYLAQAFDLTILQAIEEESGSEPSAQELIGLIELVEQSQVAAIFVETNGSSSAASVIAAETGIPVYTLDMAMSGDSWFSSMYHNIDTLKEALSS